MTAPSPSWVAGGIFAATYVLLSFQGIPRLHIPRPAAALLGAVAMVVFGVVRLDQAYRLVDFDTLVFILGMMIVISYLELTGFFEQVEVVVLERARTTRQLLALVVVSSGVLSALFMNDTICLMLTPVVLGIARRAGRPAAPYLIALATAANIGSAATPMGNPQNMIVAVHSRIPFVVFGAKLLPLAALGLALDWLFLARLYRAEFAPGVEVGLPPTGRIPVRSRLLWICLAAVALLLVLFAADVHPPLAAISIAALLVLVGATRPRDAFARVDWELLLMFAGLFVVMGGLRESGLFDSLFARLAGLASSPLPARLAAVAGGATLLSNLVSNVPCVVFFANVLPRVGGEANLWLALAAASTFAGNLTIIGSVANLIVFEGAKGECRVGFREYLRAGAPLTLLLVVLTTAWLAVIG